jgi:tetratricopeptide (TPR) repeat protein
MRKVKKLCNSTIVILLLCYISQPANALEQPHHHVGFYIENFGGRVDPETIPHVYEVFAQIRAVAEVTNRNLPQLVVIKDLPGPPAFVLPDGNLILTQQALEVIYNGVPLWEGNARLAFVLGHELAHLASDDFWSAEVKHLIQSKALSGEIDGAILDQMEQDKTDLIERELKADDKGFLYAAMAGFPVETLLAHENDFLSYWVAKTHTQSSTTHPEAIQRTNLLRVRLQQKKDALEFFYMGVRLAHFGRYQDAVYFFSEFQEVFPGREVFNNLGVCYLQMAIKKMPPAMAYQYWLPHILDNETLIDRSDVLPIFRDRTQIKIAKDFLQQAVRYLTIATEKDPAYKVGFINLAVAYFYLDEIYKARAAIEEARRLQPDDYEIESLRALILFKEGQPMDTWSYAEGIFSALANNHPSDSPPLFVYYNWARLLEVRGRSAESQWKKLTKHRSELPGPVARMLCERLKNSSAMEQCLKGINKPGASSGLAFPESLPIQPGFDAWQLKKAEHPLTGWQKLSFHWRGDAANSGIIYNSPQGGDVVLEMDGVVEMVVLKQNLRHSEKLLQKWGQPHNKKTIMNGELWSYDHWVVFLERDRIKEFWVVREKL